MAFDLDNGRAPIGISAARDSIEEQFGDSSN